MDQTRGQLETWMRAIKARIRQPAEEDGPEFQTFADWIQANRTDAERTGWQIAQLRVLGSEEDFGTEGEDLLKLGCPAQLTLFVD
jgi:hypothetical protein